VCQPRGRLPVTLVYDASSITSTRASGPPTWIRSSGHRPSARPGCEPPSDAWRSEFAHDSPLEGRRFEPSVPRRIDDAPETARFAFAALPVPPERPTRFATDGSKAENHVATVLDAGGMRILMLGYEHALRTIKELKGDQLNGLAEYQDDFRRMAARGAA
jgi:hypothetical protein